MFRRFRRAALAAALLVPSGVLAAAVPASAHDGRGDVATIFTETNAASGNEVLAFQRVGDALTQVASYPTGGLGSGAGLGSQGAIAAADDRVLAVNAGSNQLTLFRVRDNGSLARTDVESTVGVRPVSVAVRRDVAYVLNAGDRSVSGYRIRGGNLVPIPGSRQSLPGDGGAQVSFDRDGLRLVVTEKATNTIDVLPLRYGVAGPAVSNPSSGQTPFGFAVDGRNHVIVSNAAGGAAGASSVSSYAFTGPATLAPVSAAVATTQTAACWVALSDNGRYAFTTNAGSGTISSYTVGPDGALTLAQAQAAAPGAGPVDMVVVENALFTLNGGSHTITAHGISPTGALSATGQATVPTGVVGLAAA